MSDYFASIPRLDDRTALALFRAIAGVQKPNNCTVTIAGLRAFNLLSPSAEQVELLKSVDSATSYLISRIDESFVGLTVSYIRGGESTGSKRPSTLLDEIKVSGQDNAQNAIPELTKLKILEVVNSRYNLAVAGGLLPPHERSESDELDTLYRSTVLKLESSFAEQIDKITSWTVEQADLLKEEKLRLAQETQADRAALQSDFQKRQDELLRTADELDQKRRDLDDRDYMHARRAIRGDLQRLISAREASFSLSSGTKRLRLPIHGAFIILIGCLLGLNVAYFIKLAPVDWTNWSYALLWALAKQAALAAALVGSIAFYVRWMNRWFEEHANAEFLLKQFQLDIDRASWVVETALEWQRSQQAELPAPLLDGITRNLFMRPSSLDASVSAADELASALVGSAAGLKLKVGDNELSFTRKGLRKLAKEEIEPRT
jgi:hypothetical protein